MSEKDRKAPREKVDNRKSADPNHLTEGDQKRQQGGYKPAEHYAPEVPERPATEQPASEPPKEE